MKNADIESKAPSKRVRLFSKINTDYVLLVVATLTLLAVIADLVVDKTRFDESNTLTKDLISNTNQIKIQTSKKSEINDEIYSKIDSLLAQHIDSLKAVDTSPSVMRDVKLQLAYPTSVLISKINEGVEYSKELELLKKFNINDLNKEISVLEHFLDNQISVIEVQKNIMKTLSSEKNIIKPENESFKDTLHDFFGSVLSIQKRNSIVNERIINDRLTIAMELLNTRDVNSAYFIITNVAEKYLNSQMIESKLKSIKDARNAAESIMKYSLTP